MSLDKNWSVTFATVNFQIFYHTSCGCSNLIEPYIYFDWSCLQVTLHTNLWWVNREQYPSVGSLENGFPPGLWHGYSLLHSGMLLVIHLLFAFQLMKKGDKRVNSTPFYKLKDGFQAAVADYVIIIVSCYYHWQLAHSNNSYFSAFSSYRQVEIRRQWQILWKSKWNNPWY